MHEPSSPALVERRAVARVPTSLRGKVFPGGRDCRISDMTRRGARLSFDGPAPDGAGLTLVVWANGGAFEAVACWRRGAEIGVRFVASRDLRRPAPPHLAEAQALWRASRPRMGRRALIANPNIVQSRTRLPRRIASPRDPV
jgi:hypothetical protein